MKPHMIALLFLAATTIAFADITPPDSHQFDRCVKISNLNEFPGAYLIGFITGPMIDKYQAYQIKQGECLQKGYKFNSLSVYWTPKSNIGPLGLPSLKTKEITKPNPGCVDGNGNECTYKEYAFDDPQVFLLSGSIESYGGYVSNSDPRSGETVQYYLVKNAEGGFSLKEGETTTKYLDGTTSVKGEKPTTQYPSQPVPLPSPNPPPAAQKGVLESIMCFFIQLFGGRC